LDVATYDAGRSAAMQGHTPAPPHDSSTTRAGRSARAPLSCVALLLARRYTNLHSLDVCCRTSDQTDVPFTALHESFKRKRLKELGLNSKFEGVWDYP
jgi:hypothetical protein